MSIILEKVQLNERSHTEHPRVNTTQSKKQIILKGSIPSDPPITTPSKDNYFPGF